MIDNKAISINYSDEKLWILVEEYIAQQWMELSFKGLCAYILYWAKEDNPALYDCYNMAATDIERLRGILDSIVKDGRLIKAGDNYQIMNS